MICENGLICRTNASRHFSTICVKSKEYFERRSRYGSLYGHIIFHRLLVPNFRRNSCFWMRATLTYHLQAIISNHSLSHLRHFRSTVHARTSGEKPARASWNETPSFAINSRRSETGIRRYDSVPPPLYFACPPPPPHPPLFLHFCVCKCAYVQRSSNTFSCMRLNPSCSLLFVTSSKGLYRMW